MGTAQVELNKKREAEVAKLRKDVEEANIQQESVLSNLKRKQGDASAEMTEQIDALGKMKSKIEKDKVLIMNEIADARAATDEVMRSQASADMSNKKMLEGLNAINKKVDDANLTLGDFAASKNKIACENSDLLRIVGDLDNNLNILAQLCVQVVDGSLSLRQSCGQPEKKALLYSESFNELSL